MYVVDKSIVNEGYPAGMMVVRGGLGCVWGVMRAEEGEGEGYCVVVDLMMKNEGLINAGQDHNLAMVYLKGLLNLQDKIEKSRDDKSFVTVFDLDWSIDTPPKPPTSNKSTKSVPTTPLKTPTSSPLL